MSMVIGLTEKKSSEEKLQMNPDFELIPPADHCDIG